MSEEKSYEQLNAEARQNLTALACNMQLLLDPADVAQNFLGAGLGVLASVFAGIIAVSISWDHLPPGGAARSSPAIAVAYFAVMTSVVTAPLGAVTGAFGLGVIRFVRQVAKTDSPGETPSPRSPGE